MQIFVHWDNGFWTFCSTYLDCVHGQLFEKRDKTVSVPKSCPGLRVFGSFHRLPHRDLIAIFRIVFSVNYSFTEDIGVYLWLVDEYARQPATLKHAEKLLIFVDHTILWRKCCLLQSFSLLGWLPLPCSTSNAFSRILTLIMKV